MPDERIVCPGCAHNRRMGHIGKRILKAIPEDCVVCAGTGHVSRVDFIRYRFLFGHTSGAWVLPNNEWPDAD